MQDEDESLRKGERKERKGEKGKEKREKKERERRKNGERKEREMVRELHGYGSLVRPLKCRSDSLVRPLGSRFGSLVRALVRSAVDVVGVGWPTIHLD